MTAAQLWYLLTGDADSVVWIGVIPFTADQQPVWTLETFNIFDREARMSRCWQHA